MRPLIVGEAPSRVTSRPLTGRCGRRLASLAGVPPRDFARTFARVNLLSAWPGLSGKGAAFDLPEARRRAIALRPRLRGGRTVLLLGRRVAAAFRLSTAYFVEQRISGAIVVVVPHPSGVNLWWNDPAQVGRFRRFIRRIMKKECV